jgi:hypothetical protein
MKAKRGSDEVDGADSASASPNVGCRAERRWEGKDGDVRYDRPSANLIASPKKSFWRVACSTV